MKTLRIYRAPEGYQYCSIKGRTKVVDCVVDTEAYPANIDNYKLVRVFSKEEHADLLKKLETRR